MRLLTLKKKIIMGTSAFRCDENSTGLPCAAAVARVLKSIHEIMSITEMKSPSRDDELRLPGMLAKKHDGHFAIIKIDHDDGSEHESIILAEMMSKNGYLK